MSRKKKRDKTPYYVAIITAVMSGAISIGGFYFISEIEAKNTIIQKQYEFKVAAYDSFLSSISVRQSPVITEILNIGEHAKYAGSDSDIQALEDRFQKLVFFNREHQISWQLDNDFNLLRLHGSKKVRIYCDDILTVLRSEEYLVNWKEYPERLQDFVEERKGSQSGNAYVEEMVTNEERIMMVVLSALYKNLIDQLRLELQNQLV
jgi:hypothetical protein